jgi:predicted oxidoreductase (fatty acid repression mutant protein)
MPVFFSFAQVREDLARHTAGLESAQIWRTIGSNSVGFQLKHIAGSVDRITSYLMEQPLSETQMAFLRQESSGSENLADLLSPASVSSIPRRSTTRGR